MPVWAWILIVIAAALAAGAAVWLVRSRKRTAHLQERFGPEYNRVTSTSESQREAEAELARREERREKIDVRPLPEESRARYAEEGRSGRVRGRAESRCRTGGQPAAAGHGRTGISRREVRPARC
jgi:hypothetical protein